jgi:hypothetical protein
MQSSKIELTFRQFFENKSFTYLAQKSPKFDLHHQEYLKTKYLIWHDSAKLIFGTLFVKLSQFLSFVKSFFCSLYQKKEKRFLLEEEKTYKKLNLFEPV